MRSFKCLNTNFFSNDKYSLVPIRDEDKFSILQWRNEQIDILRQKEILTIEQQIQYYKSVVDKIFEEEKPNQLLWSFLLEDKLIGYGGLVHIDWLNKTAEISFITETSRNRSQKQFISDWIIYLSLIKQVAKSLNFNSIFTYAYDIRPNLYKALEESGFKETKRFKNFVEINGELKDVVIHTFDLLQLRFQFAKEVDVDLYFNWVNNFLVRQNSFKSSEIDYEYHVKWFKNKLNSPDCFLYLFSNEENTPIGQVRIDKSNNEIIIDISIDELFRGKGLGAEMLKKVCDDYFKKFPESEIIAYVKVNNIASIKQFLKAGFIKVDNVIIGGNNSFKFKKNKINERY